MIPSDPKALWAEVDRYAEATLLPDDLVLSEVLEANALRAFPRTMSPPSKEGC